MSYVNTTTPTRIWINGREYTDFLLSGSVSDESSLTTSIIKTTGTIVLGGVHDSIITREFPLPVGSEIIVQCRLPGGYSSRHPRGTLYLINSNLNYEQQSVTLEVGCSLALVSTFEQSFEDKIRDLYDLIPESYTAFDVEDFDLSELSNVLEALGYIMYQDKNGRIQCVKVFGGQGLVGVSSSSKFTSYDTSTAISIQSLSDTSTLIDPDALKIVMGFDVPKKEDEDPEEGEQDGDQVLSDVQYLRTKALRIANLDECLKVNFGKRTRLLEEKILSCGKAMNPEYIPDPEDIFEYYRNPDVCKKPLIDEELYITEEEFYDYKVEGKIEIEEVYFGDKVEKFQEATYDGPGNQLDYEKNYETLSIWRFADSSIGQWLDNVSKEYDLAVEEANAKCQEINEYAQIRDENDRYKKTQIEIACLKPKEIRTMIKTFRFYDCLVATRIIEVLELIEYIKEVRNVAARGLNYLTGFRGTSNIEERFIEFGDGGEIIKKTSKSTIHAGASKYTVEAFKREGEIFEDPEDSGPIVDERKTSKLQRYSFGPPLEYISGENINLPGIIIGQRLFAPWPQYFIKSETIESYEYERGKVTQTIKKIDYENPDNNTTDIKVSTDNSVAAKAEPRQADSDTTCNIPTENIEKTYTVYGRNTTRTLGSSWAGDFEPFTEEISMPIGFKSLLPEDVERDAAVEDWQCDLLNSQYLSAAAGKITEYERYIYRYLALSMAKKVMDNRGLRVVEKMRAEVFDYYPFMPITVVLSANALTLLVRVSSATWAFDSTNALCSFDCYVMNA